MGDVGDAKEIKKTFIVPAIKAFEHYDFTRAKICCSLTWLMAKAFGTDSVPTDLREPFYRDQYEQEHIKPPVVSLLLSAEPYCRAGSLILKSDAAKPLLGHDAVIRALAQKGLYVTDQERLVTERDLRKRPIQMSAHLAMIDTLMMAYTVEMVSVEKLLSCVQKYSPCYPDGEVPYDTEEAVATWINKVSEYLRDIITQEQKLRELSYANKDWSEGSQARYRKEQAICRQAPCLPLVDNLLKDTADGCAIAVLLHFYCPDLVKLEDICLKEAMSLADSLYNLQLIQDFCGDNLDRCCHFTLEDMVYASSSIKNNYLVFMAELFWWFEVVKPSFVRPQVLRSEVLEPSSLRGIPSVPISNATNRSFMENPPPPQHPSSPLKAQPQTSTSGIIKRSTSLSYMDGCVGTWPKEKRSSAHGISFDIPFDKEDTVKSSTVSNRGMTRSISTDGLGFKVNHVSKNMKRNLSFQPVNGQSEREGIEEEEFPVNLVGSDTERQPERSLPKDNKGLLNGQVSDDHGNLPMPSMEEALKIIHDSERPQGSIQAEAIDNGFFLHGLETGNSCPKARGAEADADSVSTEVDTGIHVRTEDIQETLDEDSSLKDYTVSLDSDMDHDFELRVSKAREMTSPCSSSMSARSHTESTASSSSGVKMTSFAEQKFKKLNHVEGRSTSSSSPKTTPESSEFNIPHMVAWAQMAQESPMRQSPRDPTQMLASEMVHLKMKLEEKRRAIEAQKKKVEEAFTRHRQKMGRTAFLNVVRKKGAATSPLKDEAGAGEGNSSSGDNLSNKPPADGSQQPVKGKLDGEDTDRSQVTWMKSSSDESTGEVDMAEYTKSIEKLNTSLNFLQGEMQRLAQQQEVIMQMREQQSWVISPSQPSPQKQVQDLRHSTRSVGSMSPVLSSAGSPRPTHRSPATLKRKSASFHSRTPRTPRPSELKITPFNRMLNTPQSVDSLPRLRKFSPSQTQTTSYTYLGHDSRPTRGPDPKPEESTRGTKNEQPALESPAQATKAVDPAPAPTKETKQKEQDRSSAVGLREGSKPRESKVSEVLTQPVTETFTVISSAHPTGSTGPTAKNLIEVPLSVLKPLDSQGLEKDESGAGKEVPKEEQKMCCGFFFKDDMKGEEDIAQKRAALLEKRLRRERETQQKRQQQEAEQEQKKEMARMKAEEEKQKKEDEKARKEFIKQEYLRRKQLKLMEDMDSVIKPRSLSAKQKKPRPKSIHRDVMESPKPSAKATAGSRPRVHSVSSLSLASLNLRDNESLQSERVLPSRLASGSFSYFLSSPKVKKGRPDSADGCLSPCRSGSRNGEKDWENGSTTSSVASNTEYTGPKLYKEPSAKSNKHIIQNALAHCCLAGKVNEGQKNKILEEMEKSEANNFLILFRDSGCQFRSVYTYCPETEEITKLAGIGPKTITHKMIEGLYKYNSDRKQFSHIPAKTMSASVDAITIYSHLWQTKKPGTPKKVHSTKS
ncbi:calmodulin-regulated spectrin-associated protein 2-like isoform X2 [Brienomyrus brachyistius]|uniref:calmodulin-regulated spectrin-associated protein 2-like isoform X2 n=1 Tax=Brienomyrus brachyistius TaxID=42636 RepID=UPI0020B2B9ED|nr:calmodulin-regulated spectrin-associated protein 2-like isoform X2 [Brienomyrus brachyistius]